jgi:hypothetical protein
MSGSPLMDEPGFVRDLEDAYRRMWQTWYDGAVQSEEPWGMTALLAHRGF